MGFPGGENDGDLPQGEAYEAGEQLTLTDDDDALPWLETDDEDVEQGSDYRILIFAALAVVALGAILFGANYFFSGRTGGVEPDGSTIAAPDEAYKVRPENAGGTQVAGTGDLSFEVGQGEGRESRLASDDPAPSIDIEAAAPTTAATPGTSPTPQARVTGVGVQVGAYSSRASAEAGWNQLRGRFEALSGLNHRILEGTADSGTIYRLQAVASDGAAADALCRSIRNAGGDCQVKR
ncbi:SPOR domain-containing protein [Altererythrobacter sp. KTW20L]|uniref:SPOR domain-containing protein n=1 Tax=Altererythrobacter sp. KTW20L TaxID=2942210 RepID=UPI0020BDF571|nr:SPOR domain-containing protein [Altererythrobacter sp. KTW20L]MCL6250986.1 SPOR domain-containing protein [Altererythrobacter sp. KTW20L]